MTTRPATDHDHHDAIAWLRPDNPTTGMRVVVENDSDGALVGAALRIPNPLHPQLDHAELAIAGKATTALVEALTRLGTTPALLRAAPEAPAHSLATAAGATVLDSLPAARIDPSDLEVIAWATDRHGPTRPGSDYSLDGLAELWICHYVASHQHFGVTSDQDLLRARLGTFVRRSVNPDLTRIVEDDGQPVAFAAAFHEGPHLMALVDSLQPEHPDARRHVETAMAALLQAVPPEPFELDGHASGRHYPAVLATIPHVTAGPLTPMEMLRITPGRTDPAAP